MITADERVTAYIAAAPEQRRPMLETLRTLCRGALPGFAEDVRYGMPSYVRDGEVEVGFANHTQSVSLYILRTDVMRAHRDALAGLSLGKGCVRYRRADQIDATLVGAMLARTAASRGPIC